MSEVPVHKDIFDKELSVGDIVLVSAKGGFNARLGLGTITKLNPKMINVQLIGKKKIERRYGYELFCVTDDPRTTAYLLKNSENIKRPGSRK